MKHSGLILSLGFSIGIVVSPWVYSAGQELLLYTGAGVFLLWISIQRSTFTGVLFFVMAMLGICFSRIHQYLPSQDITHFAHGQFSAVTGRVLTTPEIKSRGRKTTASFLVELETLKESSFGRSKPQRQVSGSIQVFAHQAKLLPACGNRIRIWGKLESPDTVKNPGGFDFRKYLREKGIKGTIHLYGDKSMRVIDENQPLTWESHSERLRNWIDARLRRFYQERGKAEAYGTLRALILGRRNQVNAAFREAMVKTGTAHLLAISGLNISLTVGTLYLGMILIRVPRKAAALLAVVLALIQPAIAGFGVPVSRASGMAALGFLSVLIDRERSSFNIFFWIFFSLLLYHTQWIYQVAFQLSFLSVFALMAGLKGAASDSWTWTGLRSSVVVLIWTFPVIIYYFHVFSWISPLANMAAIPIFNLVLLGGFATLMLGAIPFLGDGIIELTDWLLSAGKGWIDWLASCQWGYCYLQSPQPPHILGFYLWLGAWRAPQCFKKWFPEREYRIGMVLGACLLVATYISSHKTRAFEMTFFDAGINEAAFLEFEGKERWLLNAGRGQPSDQAQWILTPYLKSKGIGTVSGIILLDDYVRHTGGILTIQSNFKVGRVIFAEDYPEHALWRLLPLLESRKMLCLDHSGQRICVISAGLQNQQMRDAIRERLREARPTIVFVPKITLENFSWFSGVMDELKVKVVISPSLHARIMDAGVQSGIKMISLKDTGAVTISLERNSDQYLSLFSHRLGKIMELR